MMQKQSITIQGLRITYRSIGEGKPLLILHGWGSGSDRWEAVAELLAKQQLRVIVPDLPGFGESEQPSTPWSIENYVDFVKTFTEHIPALHDHFFLLGHSFGGGIAVKFSIKYPQYVDKLFLFGAAVVRTKTFKKDLLARLAKVAKFFSFIPLYPLAKKAIYKFILKRSDYLRVDGVMKETFLKAVTDDLSQKLLFVKIPTVIIWGDKDIITPMVHAEFAHKKIENSRLVIIEGGDHNAERTLPELFATKVLENL